MNRKLVALALLAAIISGCVSCGNAADEDLGTTEENVSGNDMTDTTEAEETTEEAYVLPELDCGGKTLTILNPTTTWGFYTDIDKEEQTGDALGDAIYERNRRLEEKYNFTLDVVEENMLSLIHI